MIIMVFHIFSHHYNIIQTKLQHAYNGCQIVFNFQNPHHKYLL